MRDSDLESIDSIADRVHPTLPESPAVFRERLHLSPRGCRVLDSGPGLAGYLVSHPWDGPPPALDTLLGALPTRPSTWYIHDIALLPEARGQGHATAAIAWAESCARESGLASLSLVAVGESPRFWRAQGFVPLPGAPAPGSYGHAAWMAKLISTVMKDDR